jgi:hypothetical protein
MSNIITERVKQQYLEEEEEEEEDRRREYVLVGRLKNSEVIKHPGNIRD